MPQTLYFLPLYLCNPVSQALIAQTLNSFKSDNLSLKYLRSSTLSCKDIGKWKSEFVAKTQFLYLFRHLIHKRNGHLINNYMWYFIRVSNLWRGLRLSTFNYFNKIISSFRFPNPKKILSKVNLKAIDYRFLAVLTKVLLFL